MNFIKKNSLYIVLFIGALGVLLAAYYEGNSTMRWGAKNDEHLQSFKDAVENAVPTHVGVWEAQASEDQIGIDNENVRRVAGAEGALARHYRSTYDRPEVHVNITCGFSRSVAAHTPDVCFTGSGSNQLTDVESFEITYTAQVPDPGNAGESVTEERTATFKTALFSDAGNHYQQRVFWGWKGVNTGWIAPAFPRMKWNSSEPICKMYISIMEDSGSAAGGTDTTKTAEEFCKAFLPELDKILTGSYVLPEKRAIPSAPEKTAAAAAGNASDAGEKTDSAQKDAPSDDFDLSIPGAPAAKEPAKAENAAEAGNTSKTGTSVKKEAEEEDEFTL